MAPTRREAAGRPPRAPHRLARTAAAVGAALLTAGCGSGSRAGAGPSTSRAADPSTAPHATSTTTAPARRLVVAAAPFTLPRGSARAALVADGDHLLLLGGLDANRTTTAEVLTIDPARATVTTAGHLAVAVHDTAGALVGGVPTTFGGGNATESAAVQAFATNGATTVGSLPIPRSDLAAVQVGDRVFLVGGYDGSSVRATTISTANGTDFQVLGDLPTPVRYPAVAALDGRVYAFGGTTTGNASGAVPAVQALDTTTGTVQAVGTLPFAVTDAVAATIGGRIYLIGGLVDGVPSAGVWRVGFGTGGAGPVTLERAGSLPTPTADAAVAVLGGRAYLVGGESPDLLSSIVTLELR